MANGQCAVTDMLSNEQLDELTMLEVFQYKHLVADNWPFQLYGFDSFGLRRLFPSGTELPFSGVWVIYGDVAQFSTLYVDHTQENEKDAQGTLQHLLDSDKASNGNIISTW